MSKARSKDVVLDAGTFGGTPACHVLVDMMNNDLIPVMEKHRVLAFIGSAIWHFKSLSIVEDNGVRERVMVLLRNDIYSRIDQMPYPVKFNSHLKNVIAHHFRKYLKEAAWAIAPQGEESRGY